METIKELLKQELKDIPSKFLDKITQVIDNHENKIIAQMQALSIIHAADALLEAKLADEEIIFLLQKHYDLRKSEAEDTLKRAKNCKKK